MYLVLFLFMPLILWVFVTSLLQYFKFEIDGGDDYSTHQIVCGILSIVFLVIIGVVTLISITNQKIDLLEVEKLKEKKEILTIRANVLMAEFKQVLIDDYPEFEKEIFNNMSPDVQLLLVTYPEIKNNLIASNYVEKIQEFLDDVYKKDLEIVNVNRDIKWRFINPWIFNSFMPTSINY